MRIRPFAWAALLTIMLPATSSGGQQVEGKTGGAKSRAMKIAMKVCRERAQLGAEYARAGRDARAKFPEGDADEVERVLRICLRDNVMDHHASSIHAALYLGDVLHLVRRDPDEAAFYFEQFMDHDARDIHALSSYALVLLRERHDYVRSEFLLTQILARHPHHLRALELKAWLELHVSIFLVCGVFILQGCVSTCRQF